MIKRKKKKIPWALFKIFGIIVLSIVIGIWIFRAVSKYLTDSSYFEVKSIVIDTSLPFIQKRDLRAIEGKNIFTIDLAKVQKKLLLQYPQVSELKIVKDFPNQITIKAVKRDPYAQILLPNKNVIIDDFARVLSVEENQVRHLPSFQGLPEKLGDISIGYPVRDLKISLGLNIVKAFRSHDSLREFGIDRIDLNNTSKVSLTLQNDLAVYLERDNLFRKTEILGVILNDPKVDLKDVKYIDLRFKEPIIGKK